MKDENLQLREKLFVDHIKYQKWNPQVFASSKMLFVCISATLIPDYGWMFVCSRGVLCCQSTSDRNCWCFYCLMTNLQHNNIVRLQPSHTCRQEHDHALINELLGLFIFNMNEIPFLYIASEKVTIEDAWVSLICRRDALHTCIMKVYNTNKRLLRRCK